MLLAGKNAVIYGVGGAIGGGVARAFAGEGARVFLAGRTRASLDKVAAEIARDTHGLAEVAVVDALDERAVDEHTRTVTERAGSIDVSFSLVTTKFVTARAAGRQMVQQGSGVILALGSSPARGRPRVGGTGPVVAAADLLVRDLAAELGPRGVRVIGIWVGLPGTNATPRPTVRAPKLFEVAAVATFLASDHSGALAGTFVDATQMFVG